MNKKAKRFDRLRSVLGIGVGVGTLIMMISLAVYEGKKHDEDMLVEKIARKFHCICPMNCSLTVAECPCNEPGGALERKAYLRSLFKQGRREGEIVDLYNQKYGGFIGSMKELMIAIWCSDKSPFDCEISNKLNET